MGIPNKSLIWEEKMISAIPLVNPTINGYGINFKKFPSFAKPIPMIIKPAINVAMVSPLTPCSCTIAYRITINAPVGPPI